jgi:hypothetical protein
MKSTMKTTSTVNTGLVRQFCQYIGWTPSPRSLSAYAAAAVGKLRDLAPYALIELLLPGGSLMALLLWVYRRQKKVPGFPESLNVLL